VIGDRRIIAEHVVWQTAESRTRARQNIRATVGGIAVSLFQKHQVPVGAKRLAGQIEDRVDIAFVEEISIHYNEVGAIRNQGARCSAKFDVLIDV
jgi:hypothetical protein